MYNIARDYVLLAFAINRHIPGYIDAYFGPEEVKLEADSRGEMSLDRLALEANRLVDALPGSVFETQRADFLAAQLTAMQTTIGLLRGEQLPLAQEVERIYGLEPAWVDESVFSEAHRQLAELLPPGDSLPERMDIYKKSAEVSVEVAMPLFVEIRQRLRILTRQRFSLPAQEDFELEMVTNQPWGAYNWFLGKSHSKVQINTDLPLRIINFLGLIAHEGYPGHHTELTFKETRLVQEKGWQEHGVALINSPSCSIAEGIANCALDTVLTLDEKIAWETELYARAGVKLDPRRVQQIRDASKPISRVTGNAAFMYRDQGASPEEAAAYLQRWAILNPAEAQKSVSFITHPLYVSYIFNYTLGMDLLEKLFAVKGNRQTWFTRLLTEPVTPQMVRRWTERS